MYPVYPVFERFKHLVGSPSALISLVNICINRRFRSMQFVKKEVTEVLRV